MNTPLAAAAPAGVVAPLHGLDLVELARVVVQGVWQEEHRGVRGHAVAVSSEDAVAHLRKEIAKSLNDKMRSRGVGNKERKKQGEVLAHSYTITTTLTSSWWKFLVEPSSRVRSESPAKQMAPVLSLGAAGTEDSEDGAAPLPRHGFVPRNFCGVEGGRSPSIADSESYYEYESEGGDGDDAAATSSLAATKEAAH